MKNLLKLSLFLFSAVGMLARAANWGLLNPAAMPVPGGVAPPHRSKMFAGSVTASGGTAEVRLPLDTPRNAQLVIFGKAPVTLSAGPAGVTLPQSRFEERALKQMSIPAVGVRAELSGLAPGLQRIRLRTAVEGEVRYAVVEPASPIELEVQAQPLAVHPGDIVVVSARLAGGAAPGARVRASVQKRGNLVLRDDGRGFDARAGDGIYTASFRAPVVQGRAGMLLRVRASGLSAAGAPFARDASAEVMVSEARATFARMGVEPTARFLEVPLAGEPGRYRVEVLYGYRGTEFAWARRDVRMSGTRAVVKVPRPPSTWGADQALVRVLDLRTVGLDDEALVPLEPLASAPRFSGQPKPLLPPSKARAAQRYGDTPF